MRVFCRTIVHLVIEGRKVDAEIAVEERLDGRATVVAVERFTGEKIVVYGPRPIEAAIRLAEELCVSDEVRVL